MNIRIRGASAISDAQKLFHFSCLETKLLGIAIRNKFNLIRNLTNEVSQSSTLEPLPESDARSMSNHLDHKCDFLKKQDSNKSNNWPRKSPEILKNLSDRKNRENFKY